MRRPRLGIARELEIGVRRDRCGAVVRDVEGDVDHVAAAMEGQHLDDLVAIRRGRLQLEVDAVRAGGELARPGESFVDRPMVGHALAEQSRLRDEGALGILLQREVRLVLVARIVVGVEGHLSDHAARAVDLGGVEIGLDGDRRRRRRLSQLTSRDLSGGRHARARRGTGDGRGQRRHGLIRDGRRLSWEVAAAAGARVAMPPRETGRRS